MSQAIPIVDDHADIRRLARMTPEFGDVALLDVRMPGPVNGPGVCRHIRARPEPADMRVLPPSARGQASDREAGLQAGADTYLVKPFSPLQPIDCLHPLPVQA
ncbi:MAG: response regulator [Comamonadaceae bacterium]|jgi:DNA-binding response OmpR family regulator|nr:response regulator [Comamonadaceae bacterium]